MATTKIGFLILELEERGKEILRLKEKVEKLQKEGESIRLQLREEVRRIDDFDCQDYTFEVSHAGETKLFTVDPCGAVTEEKRVIKA